MGTCLSKKSICVNSSSAVSLPAAPEKSPPEKKNNKQIEDQQQQQQQPVVKKEVFIIKHRISHEIDRQTSDEDRDPQKAEPFAGKTDSGTSNCGAPAVIRTSSCTKEEVDAILIQCGRLSRSSSTGKAAAADSTSRRQYSGSKRSYDFDNETGKSDGGGNNGDDERENRRRDRHHRQSPGRRRTPSRERDRDQLRSGSRERGISGGGGGGRRVSRSPGRRSESPITTTTTNPSSDSNSNPNSRPVPTKMVSVPATVSSMDHKTTTTTDSNSIKRIQVKRNAASPRARSPARARGGGENVVVVSLSRSNSRKADNSSPYRRNPLAEIDTNVIVPQKPNAKEEAKPESVAMNVIQDSLKPQAVTRSRSSRLSRDLNGLNPETLLNPNGSLTMTTPSSSYNALLLEDIQTFHQKKSGNNPQGVMSTFTLPPCVTKAQSILDAVADLNAASTQMGKKAEIGHVPVLESEVVGNGDDLMEPSFHKYVTVRRGGCDEFEEQQESSGSNSIAGSQQHQQQWVSSSGWEPNSAESTDRCAASSTTSRAAKSSSNKQSGVAMSTESGGGGKRVATAAARKRDSEGIGRGRIGARVTHSTIAPTAAAAST